MEGGLSADPKPTHRPSAGVLGLQGFKGKEFRVWALGSRRPSAGVLGLQGFKGKEFRVWALGSRRPSAGVLGLQGFKGKEFRVWALGFRRPSAGVLGFYEGVFLWGSMGFGKGSAKVFFFAFHPVTRGFRVSASSPPKPQIAS